MNAKGGMGKNSTDKVMWRLPTINDYKLADVNGIRFVMPDMGAPANERSVNDGSPGSTNWWEWSATVSSVGREVSWLFLPGDGTIYYSFSRDSTAVGVRCVSR
jgi:hypothetical protein